MTSHKQRLFFSYKMAKKILNFADFIPKWTNENSEMALVEAVEQFRRRQKEKKPEKKLAA